MLDVTDLQNCRLGLIWIQRHREIHGQPPHPAFSRALDAIEAALSMSANGPEPVAVSENWTTAELAEQLGVTTRSARRIAKKLGAPKHGASWVIPKGSIA
jgi:hypothetical protein